MSMHQRGVFDRDEAQNVLVKLKYKYKKEMNDRPKDLYQGFEEWLVSQIQMAAEMVAVGNRSRNRPLTQSQHGGNDMEYAKYLGELDGKREVWAAMHVIFKDFLYEY